MSLTITFPGSVAFNGPVEMRFGPREGPKGDDGAPGDPTFGAIFGEYQINDQPGHVNDDIGAGPVGTQGLFSINHRDRTGAELPLGLFASEVPAGGLFQVWWSGGRRVYKRIAGFGFNDFDLINGTTFNIPVELMYSTAVLPATNTPVRVTVLPAAFDPPPKVKTFFLPTAGTYDFAWLDGNFVVTNLLTSLANDGTPEVQIFRNDVLVPGWENVSGALGVETSYPPTDPTLLTNGYKLTIVYGGGDPGTGLSLSFRG